MNDNSETMQEPGQSGRGSAGAGVVVVVVVVVVGRRVVRGGTLGDNRKFCIHHICLKGYLVMSLK